MKKIAIAFLLILLTVTLCVSCNGEVDEVLVDEGGFYLYECKEYPLVPVISGATAPTCVLFDGENLYYCSLFLHSDRTVDDGIDGDYVKFTKQNKYIGVIDGTEQIFDVSNYKNGKIIYTYDNNQSVDFEKKNKVDLTIGDKIISFSNNGKSYKFAEYVYVN